MGPIGSAAECIGLALNALAEHLISLSTDCAVDKNPKRADNAPEGPRAVEQ
jgi:hypothetical protein